jgi:hypothetical protein
VKASAQSLAAFDAVLSVLPIVVAWELHLSRNGRSASHTLADRQKSIGWKKCSPQEWEDSSSSFWTAARSEARPRQQVEIRLALPAAARSSPWRALDNRPAIGRDRLRHLLFDPLAFVLSLPGEPRRHPDLLRIIREN